MTPAEASIHHVEISLGVLIGAVTLFSENATTIFINAANALSAATSGG